MYTSRHLSASLSPSGLSNGKVILQLKWARYSKEIAMPGNRCPISKAFGEPWGREWCWWSGRGRVFGGDGLGQCVSVCACFCEMCVFREWIAAVCVCFGRTVEYP